jgi:sugar lactone lactonase YvrE
VASLYAMSASIAFEPKLNKAPNDYTLALSITGGGLNGPYAVAIDASGNAWIANAAFFGATGGSGGVVEISSYGAFLSGVAGFANAAIVYPDGLAVDDSGNVWLASTSGGFNNEISDLGAQLPGPHGYSSLASSSNVAIDGSGNAWFAGGAIREYSSSGANVSANPYSGGGLTTSNSIAIDGSGSAWIPNPTGTVTKLSSAGTPLSGASGFAASACCGSANAIAIDGSGNAWITTKPGVVEVSNSLGVLSGANGFTGGGLAAPTGIAIDGAGKVWVTNNLGGADIAELSSSGAVLSPASGYINANMYAPAGLAIDGSGDIWVANQGVQNATSGNVMEFIGLAAPVITPIAAGLPSAPTANGSSNLGTRP